MKNHFFVGYSGNKRQEVENIYEYIKNSKNINIIIEPFCGSSALSYYISTQKPNKYTYILNDNDKMLIELYNTARDENKLNKLINECNKLMVNINKEKYINIINNGKLSGWLISHKVYNIRPGLFPNEPRLNSFLKPNYFSYLRECPIINFIRTEKIEFTNMDAIEIYKNYSNNKKAFIFLDPPYLALNNDFYANHNVNIYQYLYENDIKKSKANVLLCLNDIWIIRLLFKNSIKEEYDKKYESSKRQVQHLIITNF
jgi:site-specific DNA-adenine methylase